MKNAPLLLLFWLAIVVFCIGTATAVSSWAQLDGLAPLLHGHHATTCQPACQNGGLCIPDTGNALGDSATKAESHCFCRAPWVGPSCQERLSDEEPVAGMPSSNAAAWASKEPLISFRDMEQSQKDIERSRSIWSSLNGLYPKAEVPSVQPGLAHVADKPKPLPPDEALRLQLYTALCSSSPCPLGFTLEDIHTAMSGTYAAQLVLAPPPEASGLLPAAKDELAKQLKDSSSPLRKMGGLSVDLLPGEVAIWVSTSTDLVKNEAQGTPSLGFFGSGKQHEHGDEKNIPDVGAAVGDVAGGGAEDAMDSVGDEIGSATDELEDMGKAAAAAGVSHNAAGDLPAFLTAFCTNSLLILLVCLTFDLLRWLYPRVYQDMDTEGVIAFSAFGWLQPSKIDVDAIIERAGLDAGMLIEYCNLSMRIMFYVGVPMLCIMAPLHVCCGGNKAGKRGDMLSIFGMANVEDNSKLYWLHALWVWYTVWAVTRLMFDAQYNFIPRRMQWLKEQPIPRATTVLVEEVPDDKLTTGDLRRFFDEEVFAKQVVQAVYFVKDTTQLLDRIEHRNMLQEQVARLNSSNMGGGKIATLGSKTAANLAAELLDNEREVERLKTEIDASEDRNSRAAFVTFTRRRFQAIVLKMFGEEDKEEIIATIPPDPADIIWSDLMADPEHQVSKQFVGRVLTVILFFTVLPLTFTITAYADFDVVRKQVPVLDHIQRNFVGFEAAWNGFVQASLLTTLMGLLPTALVFIFDNFYVLKARAKTQEKLQTWYFAFQVFFVLLVTAIGKSLLQTAWKLLTNPRSVFSLLAKTMPHSTHFYLNLFPLQMTTHTLQLIRIAPLFKFVALKKTYQISPEIVKMLAGNTGKLENDEESAESLAKENAEPENQCDYGMGARFARFSLLLTTAVVFSTLSPLITILGWLNFGLSRVVYTYLLVYAETRKPDLGGEFWINAMSQCFMGLVIYVTLMTGVLYECCTNWIPGAISLSCFAYLWVKWRQFSRQFRWESLAFANLGEVATELTRTPTATNYKQPELPAPPEEKEDEEAAPREEPQRSIFGSIGPNMRPFGLC